VKLIGLAAFAVSIASRSTAEAQVVTMHPAAPAPGAIVRISVGRAAASGDSITDVSGHMSGEPLHFHRANNGEWHAIGAVSPDAKGEATATVKIVRASGKIDSLSSSDPIKLPAPSLPSKHPLAVSSRFTQPLDAETQQRIDRENATAHEIGEKSHDTPTLWTAPFIHPRESVITSPFGSGRMFNGTLTSRHLGVDFRGKTGEPIVAANRGVVALVANFFLAGNVVYIDHGRGIVTAYFHMSKMLVAAGDTVERGQKIGLVGSTGRVTGPHLHWSARYGAVTVNPLDLFSLGSGW
jgi:Membrane proteins related to metalloendopeptidases